MSMLKNLSDYNTFSKVIKKIGTDMSNLQEKTVSSKTTYQGAVINVRRDDVVLSDGHECFREVVEHPGGVVIVPITHDNKIILVTQWRYPIGQELIELPAGKLERGENPFLAAKRELQEETGYIAECWDSLGHIFTAPGFCDEKLYIYKATCLTLKQPNPDEGEIIHSFEITIEQALDMIKSGKINDAKTIAGINLAIQ